MDKIAEIDEIRGSDEYKREREMVEKVKKEYPEIVLILTGMASDITELEARVAALEEGTVKQ